MKIFSPSRICAGSTLALLLVAAPLFAQGYRQPFPFAADLRQGNSARQNLALGNSLPGSALSNGPEGSSPNGSAGRPAQRGPVGSSPNAVVRPAQNQEHLAQWMDRHSSLSLADQQRALQNEPGFRELPAQVQQHYREELAHLNSMNPQQRQRMLERNEALGYMTQPQRQQWRSAVQELHGLPTPRRQLVARAILSLREMPPQQRQQVINSAAYRAQFSDGERSLLATIITVEPYSPSRAPHPAP